jgi:hypothetical protein
MNTVEPAPPRDHGRITRRALLLRKVRAAPPAAATLWLSATGGWWVLQSQTIRECHRACGEHES